MAIEVSAQRPAAEGNGIIFDYHLDSEADVAKLPQPGGRVAICSTALVISTYDVYFLRKEGWKKGGES